MKFHGWIRSRDGCFICGIFKKKSGSTYVSYLASIFCLGYFWVRWRHPWSGFANPAQRLAQVLFTALYLTGVNFGIICLSFFSFEIIFSCYGFCNSLLLPNLVLTCRRTIRRYCWGPCLFCCVDVYLWLSLSGSLSKRQQMTIGDNSIFHFVHFWASFTLSVLFLAMTTLSDFAFLLFSSDNLCNVSCFEQPVWTYPSKLTWSWNRWRVHHANFQFDISALLLVESVTGTCVSRGRLIEEWKPSPVVTRVDTDAKPPPPIRSGDGGPKKNK
jgi:hypothetical protein